MPALCCSPPSPTEQKNSEKQDFVAMGWQQFSQGEYDAASQLFEKALSEDSLNVAANMGKGWCLVINVIKDDMKAIRHLEKGKTDPGWQADAYSGIAVAQFNLEQYPQSISNIDTVLVLDSKYYFPKKPEINWCDMLIIKAQAYFFLKQYLSSWQTIQILGCEYQLDPEAAETWVIEGVQYFSFEAALSRVIDILSHLYRD